MSNTDDNIETMLVRLRCESITPFGWPVVPEVKMSEATLCACARCGSNAMRSSSVCFVRHREDFVDTSTSASSPCSLKSFLQIRMIVDRSLRYR